MENTTFKFKVTLWEYESGWGSRPDETKEFDTYEAAEKYLEEFNSKNDLNYVPDWYMVAQRSNYNKI